MLRQPRYRLGSKVKKASRRAMREGNMNDACGGGLQEEGEEKGALLVLEGSQAASVLVV